MNVNAKTCEGTILAAGTMLPLGTPSSLPCAIPLTRLRHGHTQRDRPSVWHVPSTGNDAPRRCPRPDSYTHGFRRSVADEVYQAADSARGDVVRDHVGAHRVR